MENIIIRTTARVLIPFIQLFALYVVAHGDLSAGGGFQGGVIIGAGIILYSIVFGSGEGRKRMREKTNDFMNSIGVFIYAGIGVLCLLFGGMFLEYGALPIKDHHMASHLGIYGIEIGVAITVAGVMSTIYFETARRLDND